MGEACSTHDGGEKFIQHFCRKISREHWKYECRREDIIKMDFKEMGFELCTGLYWLMVGSEDGLF